MLRSLVLNCRRVVNSGCSLGAVNSNSKRDISKSRNSCENCHELPVQAGIKSTIVDETHRQTRRHWHYALDFQQCRPISTSRRVQFTNEAEVDEGSGKGDKVLRLRLATTRLDLILKTGLNISRSKIEKAFYDDRIRVNGERAKKKSISLYEGDEVDIVRGINKRNPLFIDVARVEIVEIAPSDNKKTASGNDEDSEDEDSGDRTPVVLKRYKNFTIQNYPTPWKGNVSE